MLPNNLTIYYQNVRGLRTKSQKFLSQVAQSDYSIICLTESWLTSDFYDGEYFDKRYSVLRCDRSPTESGLLRGGGVAVAVRTELCPLRRDWPVPPRAHSECIWLSIALSLHNTFLLSPDVNNSRQRFLNIACIYIPQGPGYKEALGSFFDIASEIINDRPNDLFLILGDFNVSDANWQASEFFSHSELLLDTKGSYSTQCLSDFMSISGLKQYNSVKNVNGRILDLVFSNNNCECSVTACDHPFTPEDSHHKSLSIDLNVVILESLKPKPTYIYNFHSADFSKINDELNKIDWLDYFSGLNIEECVHKFYQLINDLICKNVPRRKQFISSSSPAWHSRALRKVLNEKRKYHKRWKLYNDHLDYATFKILRRRAEKMEIECYYNFMRFSEERIKSHPRLFWSYVKSIFSSHGVPKTMFYKNLETSDGGLICDLFNDHFHSVFEPNNSPQNYNILNPPSDPAIDLHTIDINVKLVQEYLASVNVHKGAGPDGVHPLLIKRCSSALAIPVTLLFQRSLLEGCVPNIWKCAWVTPVPKGQVSPNIEKYRPISKLCQFSKIFEKIITDKLFEVVRRHIIVNQHGFFKGRSVDSNLVIFTSEILSAMDKGFSVDAIYTDFAKAFDKICHSTLLKKLWELGIHGDLFRWIKSYVERRSQSVILGGYTSKSKLISSGVPQGSHLGPLLFIIFINDIIKVFSHSNVLLYADDTKIYRVIRDDVDHNLLQEDLNSFEEYCKINHLTLNLDKCYVISFTKKKNPCNYDYKLFNRNLTRVTQIRDLGVIMDSKLTFIPHIESVLQKSYKQLGFILRVTKPFRLPLTYKILYNSYVRSHLEFACAVWNPYFATHVKRLERVQKKFIKSLDYRTGNTYTNYNDSLKRHNFQLLEQRRECVDSTLLYKIINGHLDVPLLLQNIQFRVPRRRERNCRKKKLFSLPSSRTRYAKNIFIRRACNLFNESNKLKDVDVFSCTLSDIKKAFK